MNVDIEGLRAAIAKMTPGPWYANITRPGPGAAVCRREAILSDATYPPVMVARHPGPEGPKKLADNVANMDGIVALRNAAPALLDELERLRAENAELMATVEKTLDRLDYLQGLWGKEGVTNTIAESLRAVLSPKEGV